MIVNAFITWAMSSVNAVLAFIPVPSPPDISGVVSTLSTVWTDEAWLNNYLPCSEVLGYAVVLITLWLSTHAWRFVVWVLTLAHVLGGAGA